MSLFRCLASHPSHTPLQYCFFCFLLLPFSYGHWSGYISVLPTSFLGTKFRTSPMVSFVQPSNEVINLYFTFFSLIYKPRRNVLLFFFFNRVLPAEFFKGLVGLSLKLISMLLSFNFQLFYYYFWNIMQQLKKCTIINFRPRHNSACINEIINKRDVSICHVPI